MVRDILQTGDALLRKNCAEVTEYNDELKSLLADMKDTVKAENGAGLAAPQVGVLLRVVVINLEKGFYEFINPKIIESSDEKEGIEACLSVRGKHGIVARPTTVKFSACDRYGRRRTYIAKDFFARAVCHEFDHLDGVLYIDKAVSVEDND